MNVHENFLTWHIETEQPEKATRREQMDTNLGEDNFFKKRKRNKQPLVSWEK